MAIDENDDTDPPSYVPTVFSTPKGGLFGGPFDPAGLDANVVAVIMDHRWTTSYGGSEAATTISYFFPTSASDYNTYPAPNTVDPLATFAPLTGIQQAAVATGFALVASYTNLTFELADSGSATDATLRFARWSQSGSESRFPSNQGADTDYRSDSRDAGDTFLGSNGNPPTGVYFGTDHFNTIIHEMGHAFGLKHGHDPSLNGKLAPEFNDNEFSVMTYASYLGSETSGASEARLGSSPQSYMMFDIAALQALYGANFSKDGTSATYTWDPATGQQYINGVAAPNTGPTATGKIFSTVWTQGALTTFDLSNFSGDQIDDLRPGHWLAFSHAQLADLNKDAAAGTREYMAQGNIYNALLYNGDTRSLVSNLITGSGDDNITGNDIDNILTANAGSDVIYGLDGNDTISGGADPDTIDPGSGLDTLRDALGDMNGDTIFNFGLGTTIDVRGSLIGRDNLMVWHEAGTTTLGMGDTDILLEGAYTGGDFMAVARGSGADAHTMVTFETFLPALFEGVRVDPDAINGVANQPFLTGDGSVGFAVTLEAAVSTFNNSLGFYRVAADGSIFDVNVLFGNAHNPGVVTTVSLGTPGNDERIGFFLIQDGFDQFGNLPDDLSFLTPGTLAPANLNDGVPLFLSSATLGLLNGAAIFHSFGALNPGDANQVLSGVAPGGHLLQIGFEDLPTATGDNDFQDVVVSVRTNHDDIFVL